MKKILMAIFMFSFLLCKESYSVQPDTTNKKDILDVNSIEVKYLDLKYADISKAQNLDIYLPDIKKDKYPVIFFIHGGANYPASLYMWDKLSNVSELVAENNLTNYITENTPPFFIKHGSIDNVVPYIQSVSFAEKLKEKSKNKVEIRIILGAKHGGPNFTKKENLDDVYQFINSVTK